MPTISVVADTPGDQQDLTISSVIELDLPNVKTTRRSSTTSSPHHQPTNQHELSLNDPSFGILFDVDGVLASGTRPIKAAADAFKLLTDDQGQPRVPVTFVTNSLARRIDRAAQLTSFIGVKVEPEQLIHAAGPLEIFTRLHDKFCLVVGQGKIFDIAAELGFRDMCSVEDVAKAYPLLDVVDHDNRRRNESTDGHDDANFKRVEAIVLMGEPKRWESALQIIIDLLRSDGKPNQVSHTNGGSNQVNHAFSVSSGQEKKSSHIPLIACNMDLEFKDRASTPRFGHGAFLTCLEALYKKLTGSELEYTALIGKPSEITFRFAEHTMTRVNEKLGNTKPIRTMYLIGDTPEVDIVGSNLYQRYIDHVTSSRHDVLVTSSSNRNVANGVPHTQHSQHNQTVASALRNGNSHDEISPHLPESRTIPLNVEFHPQTVSKVVPVLVCTGVYKRGDSPAAWEREREGEEVEEGEEGGEECHHGHRDFPKENELQRPMRICEDVLEAVEWILEREGWSPPEKLK